MKKFPCPYCKGQGSWVEPVYYGQGPRYDCGFCEGEGMIEIGGAKHQIIKDTAKNAEEEIDKR